MVRPEDTVPDVECFPQPFLRFVVAVFLG